MPTFLPPLDDSQFVSSKQREILLKLTEIPFGTTVSYKNLAEKVGWKKAHRAVGTLIGRNPFPLFLPCHRVICSDGSLGGFFFDLSLKSELLTFESL
jgi:O-6-methylguanine DNA methyltransferase